MEYVIMIGSLGEGYKAHGTFSTADEAVEYAEIELKSNQYEIMQLSKI